MNKNEQENQNEIVLAVNHLKKYFTVGRHNTLKAVDDVSFVIRQGETLGLVGESGCGKTTCGRTCIGLYNKTDGQVLYKEQDIHQMKGETKKYFTKQVQMIFQDPYSSLDPRMKVEKIVAEGLRAHGMCKTKQQEQQRVQELLTTVGLRAEHATRYIHEFSGGQRQRIGLARALAVEPELIICDEPISALDVSIQAQIVNLLRKLQQEKNMAYLFIAHDLSMVRYISDRVIVMYLGTIVEITASEQLYTNPLHPYTKALLSAIPILDPRVEEQKQRIKLSGELPSPMNEFLGCRFCSRCPVAMPHCALERPPLRQVEQGHFVACFL